MIPKPLRANVASGRFGAGLRNAGWIARHGGQGDAVSAYSDKNAQVTIRNFIGNVNAIADVARTMPTALGNRVKQMEADLNNFIARTKRQMRL
jgi:vancomycin permeability regulator SanA